MADGGITLTIDAALAESLRIRAEAAGQSVEQYALTILGRAIAPSGLEDGEAPWKSAPGPVAHDNGFDPDSAAYADYIDRICDEAERTGGVPWEEVQARLLSFGQPR